MESFAPSLLDKLLGVGSQGREGTTVRQTIDQVKASVCRDIEMFLNAHRTLRPEDLRGLPNAARSVLTFGLIDIAPMSLASDTDRRRITDAIRAGLTAHDKRLTQVEVGVRRADATAAGLTFTIRARLLLRPAAAHVVFDAVLEPGSKRYQVSEADRRSSFALA